MNQISKIFNFFYHKTADYKRSYDYIEREFHKEIWKEAQKELLNEILNTCFLNNCPIEDRINWLNKKLASLDTNKENEK